MNKLLLSGATTLAVIGTIGAVTMSVSALTPNSHNAYQGSGNGYGRQTALESRAKILGMTAAELSNALQTKTMSQIAVEKGLSEDAFRKKMTEAAQARWQARGLSSDEISARTAERDQRHALNSADHEFGSGQGNRVGRQR